MLAALGFTRGVTLLALLGLGVASLCLVTVGEREFAVISQFGRPVRVESTPGLKLKLPAPFQTVTRFDRRLYRRRLCRSQRLNDTQLLPNLERPGKIV